ncbi:Ig-like domain-containing protein [Xenorhabdus sp. PB62.4]|uniref:Ig-like domain-containing protein n=1 Tax=Xenorhabdus sp. PB62.4 TaxID=1851573 RepID=UPI0016570FD5|nr:Ig-like domain-containing protein [Xenorhabdus sp. PB62.4]MBC8953776.1 hypothetical protein [Xenorhabdus sp. PB62.4]
MTVNHFDKDVKPNGSDNGIQPKRLLDIKFSAEEGHYQEGNYHFDLTIYLQLGHEDNRIIDPHQLDLNQLFLDIVDWETSSAPSNLSATQVQVQPDDDFPGVAVRFHIITLKPGENYQLGIIAIYNGNFFGQSTKGGDSLHQSYAFKSPARYKLVFLAARDNAFADGEQANQVNATLTALDPTASVANLKLNLTVTGAASFQKGSQLQACTVHTDGSGHAVVDIYDTNTEGEAVTLSGALDSDKDVNVSTPLNFVKFYKVTVQRLDSGPVLADGKGHFQLVLTIEDKGQPYTGAFEIKAGPQTAFFVLNGNPLHTYTDYKGDCLDRNGQVVIYFYNKALKTETGTWDLLINGIVYKTSSWAFQHPKPDYTLTFDIIKNHAIADGTQANTVQAVLTGSGVGANIAGQKLVLNVTGAASFRKGSQLQACTVHTDGSGHATVDIYDTNTEGETVMLTGALESDKTVRAADALIFAPVLPKRLLDLAFFAGKGTWQSNTYEFDLTVNLQIGDESGQIINPGHMNLHQLDLSVVDWSTGKPVPQLSAKQLLIQPDNHFPSGIAVKLLISVPHSSENEDYKLGIIARYKGGVFGQSTQEGNSLHQFYPFTVYGTSNTPESVKLSLVGSGTLTTDNTLDNSFFNKLRAFNTYNKDTQEYGFRLRFYVQFYNASGQLIPVNALDQTRLGFEAVDFLTGVKPAKTRIENSRVFVKDPQNNILGIEIQINTTLTDPQQIGSIIRYSNKVIGADLDKSLPIMNGKDYGEANYSFTNTPCRIFPIAGQGNFSQEGCSPTGILAYSWPSFSWDGRPMMISDTSGMWINEDSYYIPDGAPHGIWEIAFKDYRGEIVDRKTAPIG